MVFHGSPSLISFCLIPSCRTCLIGPRQSSAPPSKSLPLWSPPTSRRWSVPSTPESAVDVCLEKRLGTQEPGMLGEKGGTWWWGDGFLVMWMCAMHEVHVWRDALHQLSSQKISELWDFQLWLWWFQSFPRSFPFTLMILPWQALTCLSAWAWRTLIRLSYLLRHSSFSPAGFSNVYMKTGLKTGGFCLQSRHDSSHLNSVNTNPCRWKLWYFFAVFLIFFSGHTLMRFWASLLPPQIGCIWNLWNLWKFPRTWYCFPCFPWWKNHHPETEWLSHLNCGHGLFLSMRRASTIKSPTVSPWSSRTASSCCLAPLWSGSSAGTSTPEQRRAAVKIGPRTFATPVAPLSGPTHKVFHDNFASFFRVPFGPRKSLRWQWYWK